jgi:multisubunit Na+/H+ antiporter MnhE subunit
VGQPSTANLSSRGSTLSDRIRYGVAGWAALFGVWLLLVDSLALPELLVGVVAAAVAAALAEAVREQGYIAFSPRARWLMHAPRVGLQILTDCGILGVALLQQLTGRRTARGVMHQVPIRYGDASGRAGARRAMLNFSVSITPNSYVVDLDEASSTALVHQLVPDRLDPLLEPPDPEAAAAVEEKKP